jgi:uncharacterized GH25 family protein
MVIRRITCLLTGKKPKGYSAYKKRERAVSCLEKALRYAIRKKVTIRYIPESEEYHLRVGKSLNIIPLKWGTLINKSTAELLYEIADMAKLYGGAA